MRILLPAVSAAITIAFVTMPAQAGTMKAKVRSWDKVTNKLVLQDRQILTLDPKKLEIPPSLSGGDEIALEFDSDENGYSAFKRLDIIREN